MEDYVMYFAMFRVEESSSYDESFSGGKCRRLSMTHWNGEFNRYLQVKFLKIAGPIFIEALTNCNNSITKEKFF